MTNTESLVEWKFIRRTILENASSAAITAFLYGVNAWALRADAEVTYNTDGGLKVITADANVYVYEITEGVSK